MWCVFMCIHVRSVCVCVCMCEVGMCVFVCIHVTRVRVCVRTCEVGVRVYLYEERLQKAALLLCYSLHMKTNR